MNTQKAFLLAAIVLTMASVANAELTLIVDGLDLAKPLEIADKENLIIAIAGVNDTKAENISVTAGIGKLELL